MRPTISTILLALPLLGACDRVPRRADAFTLQSVPSSRRVAAPTQRVDSAALFGSYSPQSPHWPHLRTMVTDFRTQYQPLPRRGQEIAWAAAHFDYVMSGDQAAYKKDNPGVRCFPYALFWTVYAPGSKQKPSLTTAFYDDLAGWFAAHPTYDLEHAFLHRAPGPPTQDSRIIATIWGSRRYVLNPGDSGVQAYQVDRMRRIAQDADGVFLDEFGSGGIHGGLKGGVLEYPDLKTFDDDEAKTLALVKRALGTRTLMINTAEYTHDADREMILAAGAAHLERMNNPFYGGMDARWRWIDSLLASGVTVELVSLDSWQDANAGRGPFRSFSAGDYPSKAERLKMWELASYYMVVPADPSHLLLDMQNAWSVPFSQAWLTAQEADIGHPHGARRLYQQGKDPTGQTVRVWAREFDRALVLIRTAAGWDKQRFDDSTAVPVTLPSGASWRPLHADGGLGAPVTSVSLRHAESAILIKEPQ